MVSLSSVSLSEKAKDLGYGEVYLNHGGRHEKLRFLVVFCENSELHKVFMITFHNTEPFLGLVVLSVLLAS